MRTPFDLEVSLYRTVCWFSLFDYPLTIFEAWKWMYAPERAYSLEEVYEALETSPWLGERLVSASGFYARKDGRSVEELVATRQERFLDAVRKFGKLLRVARWFARFPTVHGVAAANTLSWWNTRPDSDIDLFIIVKAGSIWSTRLALVTPFALLRRRPMADGGQDPFCFSFFATHDALALKALSLSGEDPYLTYWCASLVPVFDRENAFGQFLDANAWVNDTLPHAAGISTHPSMRPAQSMQLPERVYAMERMSRRVQQRRFPARIREMMNQDSRVVVSDQMLKFHDNDRREEYRETFEKRTTV